MIEPTVSRDVLLLTRVDKPALLRQLMELACTYSGQILSDNKMLGQLHDAGNSTTLAHYLELLSNAGMVTGLNKFTGQTVRRRASSPKLQVLNTGLMTAMNERTIDATFSAPAIKGRLVESAIGAHLVNGSVGKSFEIFYWRENNQEVDFVIKSGAALIAIEVKSGHKRTLPSGINTFSKAFKPTRKLMIGAGGIGVGDFLSKPVEHWLT